MRKSAAGSLALIGASIASLITTAVVAGPSSSTGQECAARLSDPAPLSTPDREWLQRCVSAFTVPSAIPSGTPSSATTTQAGTSTPPTSRPSTSLTTPPATMWPGPGNTGVPAFWQPATTRNTTLTVTTPGAVVQDILFTNGAGINVRANNVTIRRVLFQGGKVDGGSGCPAFHLDQVTFTRPGSANGDFPTVQHGNYTADRVKMDGVTEGFRVGGAGAFGCGQVTLSNSWVRVQSPDQCQDWHGDGVQGYDGPKLIVRNVALWLDERSCGGTAPFFYPRDQGNTSVDIDRLLVRGGGYSFRLGMPGTVRNLKLVEGSWFYGPINVRCSVLSVWDAQVATIDSNWQPNNVRAQACNTESGS